MSCKERILYFKAITKRPYRYPPNKKKIKELFHILWELQAFEIWHCIFHIVWGGGLLVFNF